MLALPVPFVLALALVLVLPMALRRGIEPSTRPLIGLLLLAALQSVLVGLRWTYDAPALRLVLPVTAAALPPLAWASVEGLRHGAQGLLTRWFGVAIVLVVVLLALVWREPIDLVLASSEAGYGMAILAAAMPGADGLARARLADVARLRPVVLGLGILLVLSAIDDGLIAADFAWRRGQDAPAIVSVAGLVTLAGLACLLMSMGHPAAAPDQDNAKAWTGCRPPAAAQRHRAEPPPCSDDEAVLDVVTRLMREGGAYRDPDLTLDKLARRAGLPARAISAAVNRRHGQNVSQFVNGHRIEEARRLLETSDRPVTAIMFEAGFQTKSNFNREFKRIVGRSPTELRLARRRD